MLKKTMLVVLGMVLAFAWTASTAEPHPRIRAAHNALREAEEQLSRAQGEFGGHRARALEHIRKAQEEIVRALEFRGR